MTKLGETDARARMTRVLHLTEPESALQQLLALLHGPVPPVRASPASALGCVLAQDLAAPAPLPAVRIARIDGWCVRAADTLGAGPYAPLPLANATWVESGAPLPAGTDAMLAEFDVTSDGDEQAALRPVAAGAGTVQPGEDLSAGVWRREGERLRLADVAALAASGVDVVTVRTPRVAWLATGERRDGLLPFFAGLLAGEGAVLVALPPVVDDAGIIADALRAADADLVLLAGGSGLGRTDCSAAAIAGAGRLLLHGLGARPATTSGFGVVAGRPVILVPGRTEDALAAWLLLARPAIRHLSGAVAALPASAVLTRKIASSVGLAELAPVRRCGDGRVEPLATGGVTLAALVAADGYVIVPPGIEGYEAGTRVDMQQL